MTPTEILQEMIDTRERYLQTTKDEGTSISVMALKEAIYRINLCK